jgi:hypothetical protein
VVGGATGWRGGGGTASTAGGTRAVGGAGDGASRDDADREEEARVARCSVVARKKSASHPWGRRGRAFPLLRDWGDPF